MILKKLHFPIFALLALFLVLQSCKKESIISNKVDTKREYINNINRAESFFANQKYDSAYYYYNKIKLNSDPKKDDKAVYALYRIAHIHQIQGDYSSCETYATEAISLFRKETELQYKCSLYSLLGSNYKSLYDYDNAIHYFNLAYNVAANEIQSLVIKNNIAVIYMDKQDNKRAIEILLPLANNKEMIANEEQYAAVLRGLGRCYYRTGNPKSLELLKKSLNIQKRINDNLGMVSSYIALSKFYSKSNTKLAFEYAHIAYIKSSKINDVDNRLRALVLLIQQSSKNQSKLYSEKYIHISDSINEVRQKSKNQFSKIKYDSKKHQEENLKLKSQKVQTALELEQQKNRNILLSFLTIIVILSSIFLYSYLKAINKKEKIQSSYDTEIRIAKKLHDELANDVYHTMAFAETQDLSSSQNKEILLNNLDTIYSRTRNISKENSSINTGISYLEGLKEMMSGFNTNTINILTNGIDAINWNALEINKKITIYRVIQELLVNMRKHSQASLVVISFKNEEKKLHINYSDNGIGILIGLIN